MADVQLERDNPTARKDSVVVRSRAKAGGYAGLSERAYYHYLVNIDSHPDFLPDAKRLAQHYLSEAGERLNSVTLPAHLRFVEFDQEIFDMRLGVIQHKWMERNHAFDADARARSTNRQKVIEALRQFAPVNLVDGAWLQNIGKAGTLSHAEALLSSIWADESGNGRPEQNHSRIYRALLESVGVKMPAVSDWAFIKQLNLLDSAFASPVFQLSIARFPNTFFPELLGMTLYYEWEASVSSIPVVALLEHPTIGIDARYFKLHVKIDNIDSGHGALAKQAVEGFLQDIRARRGEEAMQLQWRRIWLGYVAFATVGTLDQDLSRSCTRLKSPCLS
ncbi:MAG: iron-containing redox enzyme family protein [Burkholderiales bacterium]